MAAKRWGACEESQGMIVPRFRSENALGPEQNPGGFARSSLDFLAHLVREHALVSGEIIGRRDEVIRLASFEPGHRESRGSRRNGANGSAVAARGVAGVNFVTRKIRQGRSIGIGRWGVPFEDSGTAR